MIKSDNNWIPMDWGMITIEDHEFHHDEPHWIMLKHMDPWTTCYILLLVTLFMWALKKTTKIISCLAVGRQ